MSESGINEKLIAVVEEAHSTSSGVSQLRQALVVGGGLFGGGTIVWAALDLMKSEPDKAFRLLQAWGPWVFLAAAVVWAADRYHIRSTTLVQTLGDRLATSLDRLADKQEMLAVSQEKTAVAQQASAVAQQQQADKDDRTAERQATLIEYSAQQSRQALEQGRANSMVLGQILAQVADLKKG